MQKVLWSRIMLVVLAVMMYGCGSYGDKIELNGGEIYYKDGVQKVEAEELSTYLNEQGFLDGSHKTVQLVKAGDTYQFRMVMANGSAPTREQQATMSQFARNLSEDVFNHADVEIHACDARLETISVIKP